MKTPHILTTVAGVLVLLAIFTLALPTMRRATTGALAIRFIGFSNSVPTAFTSTLPAHYGSFVNEWIQSGTNVALLSASNGQSRNVILYPYAGFYERTNAVRSSYQTFLPGVRDAYGVFLRPGESAVIEVAVLPPKGPGMIRIGWSPDYYHSVPRLIEELRGLTTIGKRPTFTNKWIFSERITP